MNNHVFSMQACPHSDLKKRRMTSTTKQEFESSLLNLYKWLDYVDLEIGRSEATFDELSIDEKKVMHEGSLAEIESHKSEYDKVVEIGKKLLEELQESGESSDKYEAKLRDIQNCWATTNNRIKEIKDRIDFLMEVKQFRNELASLDLMVDGYFKWYEANHQSNQIEQFRVSEKTLLSFFFVNK